MKFRFYCVAFCLISCICIASRTQEIIQRGDVYSLKQLLDSGIDINELDDTGNAPLHHAAPENPEGGAMR